MMTVLGGSNNYARQIHIAVNESWEAKKESTMSKGVSQRIYEIIAVGSVLDNSNAVNSNQLDNDDIDNQLVAKLEDTFGVDKPVRYYF